MKDSVRGDIEDIVDAATLLQELLDLADSIPIGDLEKIPVDFSTKYREISSDCVMIPKTPSRAMSRGIFDAERSDLALDIG